jgi:outer membrane protein OmpA-like peptidoglycan-associated protein
MMSRTGFILALSCLVFFAFAQVKTSIQESFTNNHSGWYEYSGDGHSILLKKGAYEFDTPEGGWLSVIAPGINTNRDFSMEAKFTQFEGNDNNGFGLIWGYNKDTQELNNFVIGSNGYFKVWSSDESRSDAREWKQSASIKPMGQANHLRLVYQKGMATFHINGSEVLKIKSPPWFAPTVGFVTYTEMRMQVDDFLLNYETNINLPIDLPSGLKKENLGSGVNTRFNEVTPKISVDGKIIFFTRKNSNDNLGGEEDASDVWYSMLSDATWNRAVNMGRPINSEVVNNITSISQDNNAILLATSHDFELYERSVNGWTSVGTLGIYYDNEHDYFEASMSADGRAILFAAKNSKSLYYTESLKEKDIFVCLKDKNGKWGVPVNLGPAINTRGSEASPFLAADGKTLYFATDGLPGYGGMDIYMSKRLDDSWTRWSKPVNLGAEINSFGFDAYYTIPASGNYAYMCTNSGGYGESDIVRIKLPESVKPDPVVLLIGKVLNAKTNKPVTADIVFEDLSAAKVTGEAISNPSTGDYRIALPYGKNYGLHAKAKGYLSVNENLELVSVSTYTELHKDLFLVPIEIGEAIQLNNVFFEQGRPILKSESFPELDRLVQILKDNPGIEIELGGHTDNVGNPSSLQVLSQDRVTTVKNYLVKNGIETSRITGKGYGPSIPLVKNDTEEHRRMNRRVEFKITKK